MHNESVKWLRKSLSESKSKINIVVTHHAPFLKSVKEKYKDDLISAAYASNPEDYILRTQPDLWIHGHMHDAFDYYMGKTRVVGNPKGYPGENVEGFKEQLFIKID